MKSGVRDLRRKLMFGLFFIMDPFGLTLHSNHYWLESLFLFSLPLGLTRGRSSRNGREWWNWAVPCHKCQSRVTFEWGIIWANFGVRRGHFPVCDGGWCALCFTAHPLDRFEVRMRRDFNGASLAEVEDEICFKQARLGDHLCIPSQCPNCQSQNI